MNYLPAIRQLSIIHHFIDGNSIRSTGRLCGVSPTTCLALLKRAGAAAKKLHDLYVWNVPCTRIEADEVWTFFGIKKENRRYGVPFDGAGGDIWLWVALCPDTKLVVSWRLGCRGIPTATAFMHDLRSRLKESRIQLSTDGHDAYLDAVEEAFGSDIDYARKVVVLDKFRKNIKSTIIQVISGSPNPELIGTSYVERFNGTLRNSCRRYARKGLAFSKSLENHEYAVALNIFSYNFCNIHGSLKETPAMAAGLTDHVWTLEEILAFLE